MKDGMVVGNGVGQQDRVGAAELALKRAYDAGHTNDPVIVTRATEAFPVAERLIYGLDGGVAYSDSFFPFSDGAERLVEAGVNVILTSSGSQNDELVASRMKELGLQSLLTLPDKEARGFFGH